MHRVRHLCILNRILPILRVLLALVLAVSSKAGATTKLNAAQAAVPQQPPSQNQTQVILLEPGKPAQSKIAGKQKETYGFEMMQGQYSVIRIDCGRTTAKLKLINPTGAAIDRNEVDASSARQDTEFVAETTGTYKLEVATASTQAPEGNCVAELGVPHPASEKELRLQQARDLDFKAGSLISAGKFDEAEKAAQESLIVREGIVGSAHPLVADSKEQLGKTSYAKGDYRSAERWFLEALAIHEKTSGLTSRRCAELAKDLGAVYFEMHELGKAKESLRRAIEVMEKLNETSDPLMTDALFNLGNVYHEEADDNKAEALYERSLEAEEREYGANDPEVADVLNQLAIVALDRGDYVKAENQSLQALAIYEKAFGTEGYRVLFPLQMLGAAHVRAREFEKASPFCQRALAIIEKTLGPEHPYATYSLDCLGEVYREGHDFAKAIAMHQRSLAIREKKLGENHPDVTDSLDNLALLYRTQGNYAEAEALYLRALSIREKTLGPEHPRVAQTLTQLSESEMASGNFKDAEAHLSRAIAVSERNADLNLSAGSERQKLAYLKQLSGELDQAITLDMIAPELADANGLVFTILLQRKGRVLDAMTDSLAALRRHSDPQDQVLLDQLKDTFTQLAQATIQGSQNQPLEEYRRSLEQLQEQKEKLENTISRQNQEFRAQREPVTTTAVLSAVPTDSELVEFVAYRPVNPRAQSSAEEFGDPRYAVYVQQGTGVAKGIDLGDAKAIDALVGEFRAALREPNRSDVRHIAQLVAEKVFRPIEPLVGGKKHLLISPDGQLNLIPFEALSDDQSRYLIERFSITYVTTGRDLLRMQVSRTSRSAPVLVADPSFGEPNKTLVASGTMRKTSPAIARTVRRSITTGADFSSLYFAPLEGTREEARRIQALFPEARLLTGEQAAEVVLEQLNAPKILHIATHGFFLQDANRGKTGTGQAKSDPENPLLRSGLALAGANLVKDSKKVGILTALQASNLDLWGTKLVTLSACDTGLGDVKNGEGVFGLRRAFFLAGTESLVMSLWPVSDYVTRELMTQYYSGLKNGVGRGEALREAQLAMSRRKGREHPFYWASFIQAGEWANLDGKR